MIALVKFFHESHISLHLDFFSKYFTVLFIICTLYEIKQISKEWGRMSPRLLNTLKTCEMQ